MPYTPPNYDVVDFTFKESTYTPPNYDVVDFTFGGESEGIILTDIVSFSSVFDITTAGYTLYAEDIVSFQSTFLSFPFFSFSDLVDFKGTFNTKDIIVKWSCRTKNFNRAFGGEKYGANEGYGGGRESDIKGYYIEVYKTSNMTLLRNQEISITDFENPDGLYIYSYVNNVLDNTSYLSTGLTFKVYQIDIKENKSLVKSISI